MPFKLFQPSFARGEIGPDLYARVDTAAYQVAVRVAINIVIHAYGGASNRAGMQYVGPCKSHTGTPPTLVPFKFNTQDTYILEFGDDYMRVVRNDAHVLNAASTITGITNADPAEVTVASHGYSNGQQVYFDSIVGMEELNNRWFSVTSTGTNTFTIADQRTGVDIDSSGYGTYSSGGNSSTPFELATPYDIEDVLRLNFVQDANVMTLVHPTYAPRELTRTGHAAWTLTKVSFVPLQAPPTGVSVTADSGSGTDTTYKVTAISEDEEESLPGLNTTTYAIGLVQNGSGCKTTTPGSHAFSAGDEVYITGVVGTEEINGRIFELFNVTPTVNFQLVDEDSTDYGAYSSGGTVGLSSFTVSGGSTPSNTVSWTAVSGAVRYRVYRKDNGLFSFLGETEETSFKDADITSDPAITPPRSRNPFKNSNYPAVASYFQQRRVLSATASEKDSNFFSVVGSEDSFSYTSPRQAGDAIEAPLNSSEVNEIRGLVPGDELNVFTSGAEWSISSGNDTGFSASTLRQKPQTNWGSAHVPPIVAGDKILFVTEDSRMIRSHGYEISIDGYRGNDMTVFAPHLFRDSAIVQTSYARYPDPLVCTVREDGWAPALTFNPEQEVVAWSRWNTDGSFKRVATIKPSSTDTDPAPYYVVERTVGGTPAYYIERLHNRRFTDARDCFFVDSGLSLDAPIALSDVTAAYPVVATASEAHGLSNGDRVDLSGIKWAPTVDEFYNKTQPRQVNDKRFYVAAKTSTAFSLVSSDTSLRVDLEGVTKADPGVATATGHGLSDGDIFGVFNVEGMTELNGLIVKVANATADTFELTDLADDDIDTSGFTTYVAGGNMFPAIDGSEHNAYVEEGNARLVVTTIGNLWHLEGRDDVVALLDGRVVSDITIENGEFSVGFYDACSRAHVGLRYISDLGTLDPEISLGGQSIQGVPVRSPDIEVRLKDTRGLVVGASPDDLYEWNQREFELLGDTIDLFTGDVKLGPSAGWETKGRVYIRQMHPLPMTVLGILRHLDVGDTDDDN